MKNISAYQDQMQEDSLIAKMLGSVGTDVITKYAKTAGFYTEIKKAIFDANICLTIATMIKRVDELKMNNYSFVSTLTSIPTGHSINSSDIAKDIQLDQNYIIDCTVEAVTENTENFKSFSLAKERFADEVLAIREARNVTNMSNAITYYFPSDGNKYACHLVRNLVEYDGAYYGITLQIANIPSLIAYLANSGKGVDDSYVPSDLLSDNKYSIGSISKVQDLAVYQRVLESWEASCFSKPIIFGSLTTDLNEFERTVKQAAVLLIGSIIPYILMVLKTKVNITELSAYAELTGAPERDVSFLKDVLVNDNYLSPLDRLMNEVALSHSNKRKAVSQLSTECVDYILKKYPMIGSIIKGVRA